MKKLMGLLFEDEEVIEEEIFDDEPVSRPLPLRKEEKKVQNHTAEVSHEQKPILRNAISAEGTNAGRELKRSTNVELTPVSEPKPEPKRISMDIDDLTGDKVHPSKTVTAAKPLKKDIKGGYEFSPVISPIFGVDEKDSDAVIPTKTKKKTSDSHIGTIISPMYGVDKDAEPEHIEVHTMPAMKQERQDTHQEIVNLTLDDILARTAAISGKAKTRSVEVNEEDEDDSLFAEKQVINSRNISLFDEED